MSFFMSLEGDYPGQALARGDSLHSIAGVPGRTASTLDTST